MKRQSNSRLSRHASLVWALLGILGMSWVVAQAEDPLPSEMMPLAPKSQLLDITRAGDRLVAVGERGHVLISTDNGASFVQKQTPTRATMTAVYFVDANRGWAVGHDAVIIASSDGGETWSLQNWDPELEKPFLDVMFLDAQRGFALGAYGLMLRTGDGGNSWEPVENDVTMEEWHFLAMTRLNDGALLIAGEAGGLALSRDDGDTWVRMESPYEGSYFGALPWGEKGALVYGLRGNVFATQALPGLDSVEDLSADSGNDADEDQDAPASDWVHLENNSVQSFMGGALLPNGNAALVGVNGTIMLVDQANRINVVKNNLTVAFSSVVPLEGGKLLVTGEGGTYVYNY